MFGIKKIGQFLRVFRKKEDGGPTVEFVIIFIPFMILAVSGFELGLLMTRHVMLERGVTMTVREISLNPENPPTDDQIKQMVCNTAGIIDNCMTNLRIEMRPLDMRHSGSNSDNSIPRVPSCTDVSDPFKAPDISTGTPNQVMIFRACGLFVPMLPETALGWYLSRMDGGYYRLVSTTAFVMEPI